MDEVDELKWTFIYCKSIVYWRFEVETRHRPDRTGEHLRAGGGALLVTT